MTAQANPPDASASESWRDRVLTAKWDHDESPICPGCAVPVLPGSRFRIRQIGAGVERWHSECAAHMGAPAAWPV